MLRWAFVVSLIVVGGAGASVALGQTRPDAPIFGRGPMTCQQATALDEVARSRDWLFGYLTAFGESFGPPRIWLGDPETVTTVFDETCAAFPKFTLVEAAHWVILTLQDRRFSKKK